MDKTCAVCFVTLAVVAAVVGLASAANPAHGADRGQGVSDISIEALMDETQKQSPNEDIMDLVWWLPLEFWQASMAQDPSTTEKDLNQVREVLAPYTMIAVAYGDFGPFGGVNWLDAAELRRRVTLVDAGGNEYKPHPSEEVAPDARNLVAMVQPILTGILGPMGENLTFFFFTANGVSGTPIAEPSAEGAFSVRVGSETYEWRLPLGSVLPPKKCPVDDEPMPGNWRFCPWHGEKLIAGP